MGHIHAKFRPVIQNHLLCRPATHKHSIPPISAQLLPKFLPGVSRKQKVIYSQKTKFGNLTVSGESAPKSSQKAVSETTQIRLKAYGEKVNRNG